jgi:hypothetical protein
MANLQFPVRARALVCLTVRPSAEEIIGFNKDGSPRIRRMRQETKPGEIFLIEDERTYRLLIPQGFAELVDESGDGRRSTMTAISRNKGLRSRHADEAQKKPKQSPCGGDQLLTVVPNTKRHRQRRSIRQDHDATWYDWPYCIDRQPDGAWLALNRDYKPLGERSGDRVVYETHPARQRLKGLTTRVARRLSIDPVTDAIPDRIYFYDDARSPRRSAAHRAAYLEKLAMLLDLGVRLP